MKKLCIQIFLTSLLALHFWIKTDSYHYEIQYSFSGQEKVIQSNYQKKSAHFTNPRYTYPVISHLYYDRCKNWSKQQFLEYFSYTSDKDNVLSLHHLYGCNGFIESIKDLPNYKSYICALAKKIHRKKLIRFLCWPSWFRKTIYKLEKEIISQEKEEMWRARQKIIQEEKHKQAIKSFATEQLCKQHKNLKDLYYSYKSSPIKRHQQRYSSLERHITSQQSNNFYSQSYHFNRDALQKIESYNDYRIDDLQICFGNQLQHDTYQELVTVSNALATSKELSKFKELEILSYQTASLGLQATRSGLITQAYQLADFCFTVLEYAKAVGQGVAQGGANVVTAIIHPINTFYDTAYGLYSLVYALGRPVFDYFDISFTYVVDPERAEEKWQASCDRMQVIIDGITNYFETTSGKDILKDATTLATEAFITHKCLTNVKSFYVSTRLKLSGYINNPSKQLVLTTAEGIQIQIADEASLLFAENNAKNAANVRYQNLQIHSIRKLLELEPWKTILKPYCREITLKGGGKAWQVTKRIEGTLLDKGDIFYLDRLHKDHLEVFARNKKFKAVLNLDLTYNKNKSLMAKGRKI